MAYVVTFRCIREVYAACAEVCPADCFRFVPAIPAGEQCAGEQTMVINPDECIDCGACKPECPIDAIADDASRDPVAAELNARLAVQSKGAPRAVKRPRGDPPRRPENKKV